MKFDWIPGPAALHEHGQPILIFCFGVLTDFSFFMKAFCGVQRYDWAEIIFRLFLGLFVH